MRQDFTLPAYVTAVMRALSKVGHRGYLVGGSLRDLLRGLAPHDYDLTTDATPEEMAEIFRDFRVIPTGVKHGTLTVLSEGHPIEVTTHRVDGAYADARHPTEVSFTRRLEADLSRRDFTVNAMAWNEEVGLVDLFGGQNDLARGILRAVGDPEARFSEDALRILRAFRFAAQLEFEIEPLTLAGAKKAAPGLSRIAVERVFSELTRLLVAKAPERGLAALLDAGCGEYVFFDTVSRLNRHAALAVLPPDALLRLAALFPLLEAERAEALCRRWHAPNAFCEGFSAYLLARREPLPDSAYTARRFTSNYWHYWEGALALRAAAGEDTAAAGALCRRVARDGTAVEIRRLAVNGRELQTKLGVLPHRTKDLLLRLQDAVWQDPARNKSAALLETARAICERERDFCE